MTVRLVLRVAAVVVCRPHLLVAAVVVARRLVPCHWWRRPPFLPVPDAAYVQFRLETAYGGAGTRLPEVDDVVTYLEWCRRFPRG